MCLVKDSDFIIRELVRTADSLEACVYSDDLADTEIASEKAIYFTP